MKTVCFLTCVFFLFLCEPSQAQISLPPGFYSLDIASGFDQPVGAQFTTDGLQLFVWEKGGKVYMCNRNGSGLYVKQEEPVLDISAEVLNWRDHGLLGFALDPNFAANRLIYLLYAVDRRFLMEDNSISADGTGELTVAQRATIGRLTRYKTIINGNGNLVIDPNPAERVILLGETPSTGIPILFESHGVGTLVFASDGTLLLSAGEGASYLGHDYGSDPNTYFAQALIDGIIRPEENVGAFRSQMLNSLSGKLLRIDPVTGEGVSSNPFYSANEPDSPKSKVWALGLRNPFRFTIRPGKGSANPSAGDIGEIYIGDVGFGIYEELNIIKSPGMNCGWPIFEGLDFSPDYLGYITNMDEINPLGCQPYFTFGDLLKQATEDGINTVYNPCNAAVAIDSGNRFFHLRPALEWDHGQEVARVGIFDGNNAAVATIGTPESNVTGSPFQGNCSIGGFWYTGNLFPIYFRNTYFHGDFGGQWIKSIKIDFTDVVQEVKNFASGLGQNAVVCIAENPLDGTVAYVDVANGTVKAISYGGNQYPVVKMSSDVKYGTSPLTVNFTGDASFDPDGNNPITYAWDFGDPDNEENNTSTLANPSHTFTFATDPKKYVVKLTITDNGSPVKSSTDSIIISVNNTPPVISINSPPDNSTYTVGGNITYPLTATVTDAEHEEGQLKYRWQTILRHNNHEHAEPIDTNRNSQTQISAFGCNGEDYSWFIKLKVTDAAGLSATDSSRIYPACASGILNGSVTLQGHPAGQWNIPLQVDLYANGNNTTPAFTYNVTTDATGNFTINTIPPGTYKIAVKNSHMLRKVMAGQVIVADETLAVNFGTLIGGDVNSNNIINLADLGALLFSYNKIAGNPGYVTNADLNGDSVVNLGDLGILLVNYNIMGEVP
jgi:glucose/arabinose dehydrogenase